MRVRDTKRHNKKIDSIFHVIHTYLLVQRIIEKKKNGTNIKFAGSTKYTYANRNVYVFWSTFKARKDIKM